MKKITDTQREENVPTKYFQGRVIHTNKTENGNLFIKCDEGKEIKFIGGTPIYYLVGSDMHFLLPKRRVNIMIEAEKNLTQYSTFVFKLQQESRSKKYMVCEIFLP
jgi:hypothetical protein